MQWGKSDPVLGVRKAVSERLFSAAMAWRVVSGRDAVTDGERKHTAAGLPSNALFAKASICKIKLIGGSKLL